MEIWLGMLAAAIIIVTPAWLCAVYYSKKYELGNKPYVIFLSILTFVWVLTLLITKNQPKKRRIL